MPENSKKLITELKLKRKVCSIFIKLEYMEDGFLKANDIERIMNEKKDFELENL
jgi:hypothetical protein